MRGPANPLRRQRELVVKRRLGSPYSNMAGTHQGSLLGGLVKCAEGQLRVVVLGWDGESRTSRKFKLLCCEDLNVPQVDA